MPASDKEEGTALHVIEGLIQRLLSSSSSSSTSGEESSFRLGEEFRTRNGHLRKMSFPDPNTGRSRPHTSGFASENPYRGYRESLVQPEGTTAALFSSPGPCTGASAAPLKVVPQDLSLGLPQIQWNYSPAFSAKSLPTMLSPNYFSTVCVYFEADLNGININSKEVAGSRFGKRFAQLASLPLPITSAQGFTCDNCFAYVGAKLQIALTCSVGAINECHFALSTGGGIEFNVNLRMSNPTVTVDTGYLEIWNTSQFTTLYNNPAMFMSIKAKPTLYARLAGNLVAKGTALFSASLNTTAGLSIVASSPSSIGTIDAGLSGHVVLPTPSFVSDLHITDANVDIYLTPLISWELDLGKFVSVLSKETGFALTFSFGTAITADFNFIQKSLVTLGGEPADRSLYTSSQCASTAQLTATASLQMIQSEAFLSCPSSQSSSSPTCLITPILQNPLSSADIPVFQSNPGQMCLSGPLTPTPKPTPSSAPTAPGGGSVNDINSQFGQLTSSDHLSPGLAILLIILGALFVVVFFFIFLRMWCKKWGENSLPSCIPRDLRILLSDCFISRRTREQAGLDARRREAEERERERAQSALDKFEIDGAYHTKNSNVEFVPLELPERNPANVNLAPLQISTAPPPLLIPSPMTSTSTRLPAGLAYAT